MNEDLIFGRSRGWRDGLGGKDIKMLSGKEKQGEGVKSMRRRQKTSDIRSSGGVFSIGNLYFAYASKGKKVSLGGEMKVDLE